MPKYQITAKVTSEYGILVEASSISEAHAQAEHIDVDDWTFVDDEFEITQVNIWSEPS